MEINIKLMCCKGYIEAENFDYESESDTSAEL